MNICLMEHRVPGGELQFNNRPQKKFKQRSLLFISPSRKHMAHLEGQHQEVQAECRKRNQDLVQNAFISAWVESLGVPGLGPDWFIQIKRVGLWILSQRHIKHTGSGRQGKLLITRAVGKSNQELTYAYDSVGCQLGHALV